MTGALRPSPNPLPVGEGFIGLRVHSLAWIAESSRFPEAGTHVSLADIIEERTNHAFADSFGGFINTVEIGAGGLSGEYAVAGELRAHGCRIHAVDLDLVVDDRSVEDFRNDVSRTFQRFQSFDTRKVFWNNLDDLHPG